MGYASSKQENNLQISENIQATGSILDSNKMCRRHVLRKNWAKLVLDWRHVQESL